MVRIVIVEDEAVAARNLQRIISEISTQTEVLATIESVKDAIAILPRLEIDLILMDIHLSDGNAFQIFEHIDVTIPIIFTTAFDQYAIKAFKQNSIDYLLKPVTKTELELAINKFNSLFKNKEAEFSEDYKLLIEHFKNKKTFKKRFLVQVGKKMMTINTDEIAFFFVENKATYLQTFSGKSYLVDHSLSKLESQVDPALFYRVNRRFLINSRAIESIYYLSANRLKVNLNPPYKEEVLVTIDKIGKFKRWLNQ